MLVITLASSLLINTSQAQIQMISQNEVEVSPLTCYSFHTEWKNDVEYITHPRKMLLPKNKQTLILNTPYRSDFFIEILRMDNNKIVVGYSDLPIEQSITRPQEFLDLEAYSYSGAGRRIIWNWDRLPQGKEVKFEFLCAKTKFVAELPFKKSLDYMIKNKVKRLKGNTFYSL
jgi:hypothetical protein